MYHTLRENMSIDDLIQRASSLSADDASVKRLMNLIMQFRKVCNHPELFERADVQAPFAFCQFNASGNLLKEPNFLDVPYGVHSEIQIELPRILTKELLNPKSGDTLYLDALFSIWRPDHIAANRGKNCIGRLERTYSKILRYHL